MCDRVVRLVGSLSALASCRKWIFHIKETMERYMKQTISHWIPAVFCTFISLIAISGSVASDAGWWRPVFFSFLPMCFVFVGFVTFQMQCKIRELQKHLAEMQGKWVGWYVVLFVHILHSLSILFYLPFQPFPISHIPIHLCPKFFAMVFIISTYFQVEKNTTWFSIEKKTATKITIIFCISSYFYWSEKLTVGERRISGLLTDR